MGYVRGWGKRNEPPRTQRAQREEERGILRIPHHIVCVNVMLVSRRYITKIQPGNGIMEYVRGWGRGTNRQGRKEQT
ncbi:MAG: hypothetical protein ACYT04_66150 [Nostoc sp.]